jgi:subtilisin family serine protease
MNFKQLTAIAALCLPGLVVSAQNKAPENWFTLEPTKDNVNGTGGDEALKRLKEKGKKGETVIVAVLDSGVEVDHEDLVNVMWTNPNEIPGNNKDDDNNGYVDDIHGWNFLGGKDGRNINEETLELTREYVRLSKRFKDTDAKNLHGDAKKEYQYYQQIKTEFETQYAEAEKNAGEGLKKIKAAEEAFTTVEKALGKKTFTLDDLKGLKTDGNAELTSAVDLLKNVMARGITDRAALEEAKAAAAGPLAYNLNPNFNPRDIVGDDPNDLSNRFYGSNDYEGPDAFHGTHVAGIIAADRNNNKGIRGIADNVRIMTVRCVPDGDERDKDVANAIYYAVDNGASIINMSFGKGYSPNKAYVDAAMKYAADHDVLLVHAAGNSAANNDKEANFPNDEYAKPTKKGLFKKEKEVSSWMEIGALHWRSAEKRVAGFSNYGKKNVDLFSPGVALYSTVPDGGYGNASGTSMASPAAAGVAAILRSYYPELTAKQIKNILEKSVVKQDGEVLKPGSATEKVKFSELCASGGIISATNAIALADKTAKAKKPKKAIWREAGNGKLKKNLAKEPRA